jgi:hypothetical protein
MIFVWVNLSFSNFHDCFPLHQRVQTLLVFLFFIFVAMTTPVYRNTLYYYIVSFLQSNDIISGTLANVMCVHRFWKSGIFSYKKSHRNFPRRSQMKLYWSGLGVAIVINCNQKIKVGQHDPPPVDTTRRWMPLANRYVLPFRSTRGNRIIFFLFVSFCFLGEGRGGGYTVLPLSFHLSILPSVPRYFSSHFNCHKRHNYIG